MDYVEWVVDGDEGMVWWWRGWVKKMMGVGGRGWDEGVWDDFITHVLECDFLGEGVGFGRWMTRNE